jgi:hypothetical protein
VFEWGAVSAWSDGVYGEQVAEKIERSGTRALGFCSGGAGSPAFSAYRQDGGLKASATDGTSTAREERRPKGARGLRRY